MDCDQYLISFNPLNQVYRLNSLTCAWILVNRLSFNPLNQVYRLNDSRYNEITYPTGQVLIP